METGEIMLMLLVLGMCILPIYWLIRAGNSRKRKLYKELLHSSGLKKLTLDHEQWSNKIIAIDSSKLYYISLDENDETMANQTIHIADIMRSTIFKDGDKNGNNVSKISLDINVGSKNNAPIPLNIYSSREDDAMEIGYYLALAKRWQKAIQDAMVTAAQAA